MVKEAAGRPLGDRLTWAPAVGAEAVKKTGWARAWEGEGWGVREERGGGGGVYLYGNGGWIWIWI